MPTPTPRAEPGRVLDGRYRLVRHVADGGMATVWEALDERLERSVAVKLLRPGLADNQAFADRFRREARAAARLNDPRVVAVYDQGADGVDMFLVMELVRGRTLREVVQAEAPLTPRAALDLLIPVAEALGLAHRAGIVHRDVKPENVIIREDGQVKVADFGLARALTTQTATAASSTILGTVSYLSPEQVEHGTADARSDVYAAGLILFELLTGRKAFQGESPIHVAYQHVHTQVPAPSSIVPGIPEELDELVAVAAHRDPSRRSGDGTQLAARLRQVRAALTSAQLDGRPSAQAPGVDDPTVALTSGTDLTGARVVEPVPGAEAGTDGDDRASCAPGASLPDTAGSAAGSATDHGSASRTAEVSRRAETVAITQEAPAGKAPLPDPLVLGRPIDGDEIERPRRRVPAKVVVSLVALLALGGTGGGWWLVTGPGAMTKVPPLGRIHVDEARSRLQRAHLEAAVEEVYDETVPVGMVVRSSPDQGTPLHRTDDVSLVVSRGPERHPVPALAGRSQADAERALRDARLAPGTIRTSYHEQVPAGAVIGTDPAPGTSLRPFTKVALAVSRGPRPIPVPSVLGRTPTSARKVLSEVGLGYAENPARAFSSTVPDGSIVTQSPATGTLHAGQSVTVTLSKGPEMVLVPGVVGRSKDDARQALEAAGFTVKVTSPLGEVFGLVSRQSPGPTRMPRGSTVTIVVV
ncbi:Stk1 family PASTA domain-containing Ser/Thr kinase [Arsenicicoccus dermatophilus]|uniref:Stk1 family PASTA domain-containing Ser/Thr kinase n=1 Tax=Arsenicicoccus dermatophilus TaxID=1076331 RepID=UPI001F4CA0B4|nr:Stk1 family PASTA domain-containing Ser/Thr kinase [Arsenicicoccus dermatophilus]